MEEYSAKQPVHLSALDHLSTACRANASKDRGLLLSPFAAAIFTSKKKDKHD